MSDQPSNVPPRSIFDSAEPPDADALRHEEDAAAQPAEKAKPDTPLIDKTVDLGGINPYDHSEEERIRREKDEELGVSPPDLPDGGPIPVANPAMLLDSTDSIREEIERRFKGEFGDRKVEVTAQERSDFVRAALHDEELVFRINVDGASAVVDVAIPPDYITTFAASAVNKWAEVGFVDAGSDMQWLLSFQQVHAWYQIRAVNGEPTSWSDFWTDRKPSASEIRSFMKDPQNFEPFFKMNAVRWRLILDAIRVAELKYKICLENWNNRSFFTGADTA